MAIVTKKTEKGGGSLLLKLAGLVVAIGCAAAFWTNDSAGAKQPFNPKDFWSVARATDTDKVWGPEKLAACRSDISKCFDPSKAESIANPRCRVAGHFYGDIYNRWLEPFQTTTEAFQLLEIGFYNGRGMDAFRTFLSPSAELHSIEKSCSKEDWKGENFAAKNAHYSTMLKDGHMHCGDATDYDFLDAVWSKMKSSGAPLKVVVDDASHSSMDLATTLFYWFPKLAPGGVLILEDLEPRGPPDMFRLHTLPQLVKDIHYCGRPDFEENVCFPTIRPLLKSVHCGLHICVVERNEEPAAYLDRAESKPPAHALDKKSFCMFK